MIALWACTRAPEPRDHHHHDPTEPTASTGDTAAQPPPDAIADARVSVHPDVATVLVVDWTEVQPADEVWVTWTLDGIERESRRRAVAAGPGREVVLGLPASTPVPAQLHAVVGGIEQVVVLGTTSTGALPDDLPLPEIQVPGAPDDAWILTSVSSGNGWTWSGPFYSLILDRQGRIVWYRHSAGSRLTWEPRVSRLGPYLLVDESTQYAFSDPGPPDVARVSLDHAIDDSVDLDGMTVAYDELDDGSFAYSATDRARYWVSVQRPDGSRKELWSCTDWLPANPPQRACEANTIQWSPERQTLLYSMFAYDTIVELGLDGSIARQIGAAPGSYGFDPPDSAFALQHFPGWTPDGTLLVSAHAPDGSHARQWTREYAIDDRSRTAKELWSASSPDWAEYAGAARRLSDGDTLWELGVTGVIEELDPQGQVVWQIAWPDRLVGTATDLPDLYALVP